MLIVLSGGYYLFFSHKDIPHTATTGINTENVGTPTELTTPVSLNIESAPPGARIFIDGSFYGTAPLMQKLPLGKYEVRLSLKDYYDWEAQLQLDQEGEKQLSVDLLSVNDKKP